MKTETKQDKFQKVVESATLKEVILISSACKSYVHYTVIKPSETKLEFTKKVTPPDIFNSNNKKSDGLLSTHFQFVVDGKSQENIEDLEIQKGGLLFSISVSYMITYIIKNISSLDHEILDFFGKENAFFNVYPYLRECINHMSSRLNISPIILPLLKPTNQLKQKRTINQKKSQKVKNK